MPRHSLVVMPLHIVWATKRRARTLMGDVGPFAYQTLIELTDEYRGVRPLACNGFEDHVHLAVLVEDSKFDLGKFTGFIKGKSSSRIADALLPSFEWQRGVATFGFGMREVKKVCGYIRNQEEIHTRRRIRMYKELQDFHERATIAGVVPPPLPRWAREA